MAGAWQVAGRRCLPILTQVLQLALPKGNGFLVLAGLHHAVVKSIRLVGGGHFMLKACFLKKV